MNISFIIQSLQLVIFSQSYQNLRNCKIKRNHHYNLNPFPISSTRAHDDEISFIKFTKLSIMTSIFSFLILQNHPTQSNAAVSFPISAASITTERNNNNNNQNNDEYRKYLSETNTNQPSSIRSKNPFSFGVDSQGSFNICPGSSYSLIAYNCISSQDDRPQYFLEPVSYDDQIWTNTRNKLLVLLTSMPGTTILNDSNDRYLHVKFAVSDMSIGNNDEYDECEFYFTPNDNIIQFRSLRQYNNLESTATSNSNMNTNTKSNSMNNVNTNPYSYIINGKSGGKNIDVSQSNRKRIEMIIKKLNLEYIPVLRNRQSVLFGLVETPFDSFGPPTVIFDQNINENSENHDNQNVNKNNENQDSENSFKNTILEGMSIDDLVGLE